MSMVRSSARYARAQAAHRAQVPASAVVQLEFSFDEALNEADAITKAFGDGEPTPEYRPIIALLSLAAELQFTGGTDDEWALIIDEARNLRFFLGYQPDAPNVSSPSRIRQEVEAERRTAAVRTEGEHSAVYSVHLFAEMARHGLADMLLRRDGGGTRRCTWCGTWFTPSTKAKSRFCSRDCRSQFYNARVLRGPRARFTCVECKAEQDIDRFSGLQVFGDPARVQIGSYHYGLHTGATGFLCRDCITKNHREWNSYVESSLKGITKPTKHAQNPFYVYMEPRRS